MGGHRIPRNVRGRGSGAGGRNRYNRGETCSKVGEARRKTEATATAAAPESEIKRETEDPPAKNSNNRAGGKYRMSRKGQEEIAKESANWSGEEKER